MITDLLEKAVSEASKLPAGEQDTLAAWILDELASERRWAQAFSESADVLKGLADEALGEHRKGDTEELAGPPD